MMRNNFSAFMKRLLALFALSAVLTSCEAFGAVQNFGEFRLDIPQGWTAKLSDDDIQPGFYTVNIEKDDKSSLMLFSYGQTYGAAIEEMVETWANMEESSSKPKRTSDGYYMFTYKNVDGKKATVYASSESGGKIYVSAEMTGKDMQTMTAIRDSFALKNAPQKSSKPEKRYYNENTELILAAVDGNTDTVKSLLSGGSDVNARNIYGMTALMYAAEGNHSATVEALLKGGAEIDARNNEGSTALIIAAIHGSRETINVLVSAGADIEIRNNNGKTAADYARGNDALKDSEVLELLEAAG